jgi:ATP/maltotriose-dependent transcriptional regulator MalT
MAKAVSARALRDPAAVLRALAPVAAYSPCDGLDAPGFWPWQPLYGDALVATGRHEEASAFLPPHERSAEELGHAPMMARLALVRGRLEAARGDADRAEAAFARALEHVEPLGRPYERALTQLATGQFLRRTRRRRRAVALLNEAAETFAALRAKPAAERCARELRASGLQPGHSAGRPADLTSQERVVAELAAAGRTNRGVAEELQLSVKTVEIHLSRVYSKLGIRSRRQIAERLPLREPLSGSSQSVGPP